MGLIFKISWGSHGEPWEILKILCVFVAKSLNMGTYFWKNYP